MQSHDSEQISPVTTAHHTVYEKTRNLQQNHACQWGARPHLVGPPSRLVGKPPFELSLSKNVLSSTTAAYGANSAISFGLSCTTYICIWLPFFPYAYYMWLPWFISLMFLGFSPPESLPADDVLCRLLPRPLPSVCFLLCLFVLFCFVFFPTVFVPDLFWCKFLYLVTTAGFVADQLIM